MNSPDSTSILTAADTARRFGGVARVYGDAAAKAFKQAEIAVIGIGGVGSWTVEALARSGVGALTLIDLDHVSESNTNRQIHALGDEYGKAKVLAMAQRIAAINPECQVRAIEEFIDVENIEALIDGHSFVIDCIDQVRAKAALVSYCRASSIPIVTCGAAGGRVDPTRVKQGDLALIIGDPLLAKLRHRLRHEYGFARDRRDDGKDRSDEPKPALKAQKFGVTAVYSDEPVRTPAEAGCAIDGEIDPASGLACAGFGSSMVVTATFGLVAAACALDRIALLARRGP